MSEDDKPRGEPAVKAKLPDARKIGRSDFTPHGIGGRGRTKPSAMTAAKAKQRRRVIAASTLVAVLAATALVAFVATRPEPAITVTGAFGSKPRVDIPEPCGGAARQQLRRLWRCSPPPPATLRSRAVIAGKGAKVADGETAILNIDSYAWGGNGATRALDGLSTFKAGTPLQVPLAGVMPGLKKGLLGRAIGSRMLLQIPPKDGLGAQDNPQLGTKGTDTLVLVVDVLGSYGRNTMATGTERKLDDPKLPKVTAGEVGKAPSDLKMPKSDPPGELVTKTLIEGSGAPLATGKFVVARYKGQLWRDGKVFDSSWTNGQLLTFKVGGQEMIKGVSTGLAGQKVGSRVMIVIPPEDGYGKQGEPRAGIKGNDTLVFVVDILGAH